MAKYSTRKTTAVGKAETLARKRARRVKLGRMWMAPAAARMG